jgi:hypothetical protein
MHQRNGCHLALFAMLRGASLHLNKEGEGNRIPTITFAQSIRLRRRPIGTAGQYW